MIRKPENQISFTRERGVSAIKPALYRNRAYLHTGGTVRELVCIDWREGVELWRRPIGHFTPREATESVVLLHSVNDMKAVASDGQAELWRRPAGLPSWTLWRDRIVMAGNPLQFLRPESGEVLDSFDVPFELHGVVMSGDYCLGHSLATYLACDLESKLTLWHRDLRPVLETVGEVTTVEPLGTGPGVGDTFVLTFRNHAFGFSVKTGDTLWQRPLPVLTPPTVTDDRVYSWSQPPGTPGRWTCLDSHTGETIYDHAVQQHGKDFLGYHEAYPPLVHRNAVLVTTRQGLLAAFSPATGELLWHYKQRQALGRAVLVEDRLLVPSGAGFLLVFEIGN